MKLRPSVTAVAALLACCAPSSAQTITGIVLDAGSGERVARAQVVALTAEGRAGGRTVGGADGTFTVSLRAPGSYRLQAERQGYLATNTPAVEVGPRDTVVVEVRVSAEALTVAPLTVTARRQPVRRPSLDAVGFYGRELVGLGRFLHREDLERQANQNLVQVLDRLPGTTVVRVGRGVASEAVVFERSSNSGGIIRAQLGQAAHCLPKVYLDGVMMFYDQGGMNAMIEPDGLEAIEVYSSTAQVPAQFNNDASCGVILMWTKKS